MAMQKALSLDELKPGTAKSVVVGDKELAFYNVDGKLYATSNTCLHVGGPLGEGELEGSIITCPLHGWQYNVESGQCINVPVAKIQTYKVEVKGSEIFVDL